MANRVSALEGHYRKGKFGNPDGTGVTIELLPDLTLHQIAAWPETVSETGKLAALSAGVDAAPGPGQSVTSENSALLRIEPLKWWQIGREAPELLPDQGTTVDLSHSRTRLRLAGTDAAALLNRLLPLDLRESSFPEGTVASSAMHHVGVTLWRAPGGYELFIPRGFALSIWQVLFESSHQFGVEVL